MVSDATDPSPQHTVRLAELTWPEVACLTNATLVVPVGSCEQHGPHLPLDTDTRIAIAVSEAVAQRCTVARPWVVAPALTVTASGEHQGFAGTLSIGTTALEVALVELVRSADHFRDVVVVNGHGGNVAPLARVAAMAADEGRSLRVVHCHISGGDPHAGHAETSLLLALCPEVVRLDRAAPGETRPWSEIGPVVLRDGVGAVSANGVLGDPTRATAVEGERLFSRLVDRVLDDLRSEHAGQQPRRPDNRPDTQVAAPTNDSHRSTRNG